MKSFRRVALVVMALLLSAACAATAPVTTNSSPISTGKKTMVSQPRVFRPNLIVITSCTGSSVDVPVKVKTVRSEQFRAADEFVVVDGLRVLRLVAMTRAGRSCTQPFDTFGAPFVMFQQSPAGVVGTTSWQNRQFPPPSAFVVSGRQRQVLMVESARIPRKGAPLVYKLVSDASGPAGYQLPRDLLVRFE